jgi:LemA protein
MFILPLVIGGTLLVAVALYLVMLYNGLVLTNQQTNEAWSDIDVQLKRRYDLIPNLMETVKGYATHEKEVFLKVSEARSAAMGASSVAEKNATENQLSQTLKSLFAVSEAYPQLKANENFLQLQDELSDTENKIQSARRFYNSNVMNLNTKIQQFPANLFASGFGFKQREYFELQEEAAKEPVRVSF